MFRITVALPPEGLRRSQALTGVVPTQEGSECFVIVGSGGDLGAEAVGACCVVLMEGCWGRRLAGEGGEECAARRLGSEPDANYDGLGVLVPTVSVI